MDTVYNERDEDGWWGVWRTDEGDETGRSLLHCGELMEDAYQQGIRSVQERREADVELVAALLSRLVPRYVKMVDVDLDGYEIHGRWSELAQCIVDHYHPTLPDRETLVAALLGAKWPPPHETQVVVPPMAELLVDVVRGVLRGE